MSGANASHLEFGHCRRPMVLHRQIGSSFRLSVEDRLGTRGGVRSCYWAERFRMLNVS